MKKSIKKIKEEIRKLKERNDMLKNKIRTNPEYLFKDCWEMEIQQNNYDIKNLEEKIHKQ
ncbi:hypothetical protein SH1V18_48290 [Vallitalea longa]|uniref:Uncharacterized protein n=1 Tax=Vallitalea longa TaxID=2936439 RepID=A0A9W5YI48_9FIRM|nr:hypothetical protein [Vallitalea longa]GKX32349.1 hypothetical protein SH1V18_48290 [Vallitalea longa]